MWEAIQRNKIKSAFLIIAMGLLLLVLGTFLGRAISGGAQGALFGIFISGTLWFFLTIIAVSQGHNILLSFSGAREVSHDDAPQLYNIVEEMRLAAALPQTPRVFIMESRAPNAFAVGTQNTCAVAVTTGLLSVLSRDELQGVIAHEIGHIKNQDTKFMTIAGVMLGTIVILADVFTRSMFYGGMSRRRSSSDRNGNAQIQVLIFVFAVLLAILAPLLAQILYFACSRSREYLADASAAIFTRYPEGLASALEKISSSHVPLENANRVTAPMFIVNPMAASGANAFSLFSTHPPTEERIRILRSMAGGAGLSEYNRAFRSVTGKDIVGASSLRSAEELELRGIKRETIPSQPPPLPQNTITQSEYRKKTRESVNILHRLNKFIFIQCPCGLKIKVPPTYSEHTVNCPRCGKKHSLQL